MGEWDWDWQIIASMEGDEENENYIVRGLKCEKCDFHSEFPVMTLYEIRSGGIEDLRETLVSNDELKTIDTFIEQLEDNERNELRYSKLIERRNSRFWLKITETEFYGILAQLVDRKER